MSSLSIIIVGAGKGTRMKSSTPKVLHKIAGREMINLVLDSAIKLNPSNISLVISEEMSPFSQEIEKQHPNLDLTFALQKERKGTAHAVEVGLKSLTKIGDKVIILYADTPLLKTTTLQNMIAKLDQNTVCVLGFDCFAENKYGRLVANKESLEKIVEFKDASPEEKQITLCNSGVVGVSGLEIENLISKIDNKNLSGEYYLTDIVGIAKEQKFECSFFKVEENEVMGVNSKLELAKAESIKQQEIKNQLMIDGVTMRDPQSVYCSYDTKISNDVVIGPNVFFGTGVEIQSHVEIKAFCHIEEATIASGCSIGPFARIRPQTIIEENSKIGNFVEIKKSNIKKGAKISHLSYIGDAEIGEDANIGAGTITCNYDGYQKFNTKIGKNVFVGSNTSLVAPLEIGENSVIGAGSVVTKNINEGDLATSRSKQENIQNGGTKYHNKRNK